ncbi:phage antirepressor N-terminal domain-containing protein [Clostridium rectalis]|uniref:phage antirepressor N-terminal domain-containing protein n=1 Tax=Clostridium rectalis TaxID=2040295 RepID=UPI000F642FDC|nr:phage antirepressor N-terminal domain-containing protein [Clostridium rectalis]
MKKEQMETKLINFNGDELLGIKTKENNIYLGVKKACLDIGFNERQSKYQVEKLSDDLVLNKGVRNFVLPSRGGKQETVCLHEDLVTLWLAKITLTPKMQKENPRVIEKLIKYQLQCAKVLHDAFMGTEEKKKDFYNEIGLKGKIVELQDNVQGLTNELHQTRETLDTLIDNSVINSYQAQKLNKLARNRVKELSGGSIQTKEYKKNSRMYFKRLWNNLNDTLMVSTYKDINPMDYEKAIHIIESWENTVY